MATLSNSIAIQEYNEYKPRRFKRSEDDELIDLNMVIKGWYSLIMEFEKENEIELRDESYEIIKGLIELRDNSD